MDIWAVASQVSVVLAGLAAGGTFTVPAIRWLKAKLKTNGWQTQLLVVIFATLITLATSVVEGVIAPGTVNPQTWGAMVLAIAFQAEARYNQINSDLNK